MDMKMAAQVQRPNEYPIWDVKVENGIVPFVTGANEELQRAILAGFLERGTIPNLPLQGVPWTRYLAREITFGDLDVAVRDSLRLAGADGYQPEYDLDGDRLTMRVGKVADNDTI